MKAKKFLGAEIRIYRLLQNPKILGEQTTQIPKLWAQQTVTTKHFRNF